MTPANKMTEAAMEILRLQAALSFIAQNGCESFTGESDCWKAGRTPDCSYGADRCCAACIALRVLGEPMSLEAARIVLSGWGPQATTNNRPTQEAPR